jgi:hypothetical protein
MGPGMDENHETFARMCAAALSAWDDADDWQRKAIEAIHAPLVTALCGASLAVDAMMSDEPEPEGPAPNTPATSALCTGVVHFGHHMARTRTCGKPLIDGACVFHGAPETDPTTVHLGGRSTT